jgi:hypothetical protein
MTQKVGLKGINNCTKDYFLPLPWCFAGSETCFLSFRFWSFSRCSFLCCSSPSAFFAFLDKIYHPLQAIGTAAFKNIAPKPKARSNI